MTPEQLLRHYDHASYWSEGCGLDLAQAYEKALAVRELRLARGETPRGFKVGFTNRNIWPRYQVFAPIWGTVYDTTLSFCDGDADVLLNGTCEPRLEPECVLGIARTPPARPTLDALWSCVDWAAPGLEIVQSHMPGWRFSAADSVADGGLHAKLVVGRRVPAAQLGTDAASFEARLAAAQVLLRQGEREVERGVGANVLDGPLHALLHFVQALRDCPGAPDLQPGDVVTTGTWTDAWAITAGMEWTAEFGPPLSPLRVKFR